MDPTPSDIPRPAPIPWEGEGGLVRRLLRTLGRLIAAPGKSFRAVPDPVEHGKVLVFLAALRLPVWCIWIIAALATRLAEDPESPVYEWPPIAASWVDATFADALGDYLMLMIPIGLPMLYFFAGLFAHIGLALTGGARQSIGATMRASGYAMAPALLLVSVLDPLVHFRVVGPDIFGVVLGVAVLSAFVMMAITVARTHQTVLVRGALVVLVPVLFFGTLTVARSTLALTRLPFGPEPTVSPYIPLPPP